jgi:hypothetical protein
MVFGRKKDTDVSREGLIDSYTVTYKGGLRELSKAKLGKITLDIYEDRFRLTAGNDVARKFWTDIEIPYKTTSEVVVADRTVSTFEGLAGGLNSRQLNQKNNIHFSFLGSDGRTVLRVEMLTGVTVSGQAKRCQEFEDRLRSHQIRERFGAVAATHTPMHGAQQDARVSTADEMGKLAALRDQGILSDEEFQSQKNKLLV